MPWLMCRDRQGTVVMPERFTIPVLLVVQRGSVAEVRSVEESLSEATVQWPMP